MCRDLHRHHHEILVFQRFSLAIGLQMSLMLRDTASIFEDFNPNRPDVSSGIAYDPFRIDSACFSVTAKKRVLTSKFSISSQISGEIHKWLIAWTKQVYVQSQDNAQLKMQLLFTQTYQVSNEMQKDQSHASVVFLTSSNQNSNLKVDLSNFRVHTEIKPILQPLRSLKVIVLVG